MKLITHCTLLILCCLLFISGMANATGTSIKPKTIDDIFVPLNAKNQDIFLQEASPGEKVNSAKEIVVLFFDETAVGVELVIKGDGAMPDPVVFEIDGTIMIDIPDIAMKAPLPSDIPFPVKNVRYRAEKEKIRVILDVEDKVDTEVFVLEDEIVIDIAFKDRRIDLAEREDALIQLKDQELGLISLDFQDADIVPILRLLGEVSGYNIVVHPDVKGTISMRLLNVPWEQALDIILKTFNLRKVVEDNVIRIATLDAFQKEREAIAKEKEVFEKAEDLKTKIFAISYADVDKVKESIEKVDILSPRGSISTDLRTRSIIANDIPSRIDKVQKLLETLDKPTAQIMIEARMVEMSTIFASEFGVQWGGQWQPNMGDRNTLIRGSVSLTPVVGGRSPVLADLGVGAATGAVTIGFLNAAETFGLDIRLSALESIGKAKIVSNPRIMTADSEEAVIKQGRKIVIPIAVEGRIDVREIEAALSLTVTPKIGADNSVLLEVKVTNNEPVTGLHPQIPDITIKEATTRVLLRDGETVVIGGILKTKEDEEEDGLPGLSKVPVLGWLFKKEAKKVETEELLIFITPRIVKL